ncbi:hypothetical protein POTOM_015084 [Populus tomentosa]|uniref:Uncharacterized protein n=1 Tax=Populus tomentosa TaxID=118781 RepID=A0A8X7ZZA3_POPTO|nr:hypothetical protein POTOM_015084 [Populus tomentosa]
MQMHLPRINVLRASNTWTEVQSNSHGNSSAMTSTAIFCHSICSSATNLERKTSCEKSCQLLVGFRATYGVINKYISSTVALDVLRDGQMRIALGSTRGAEIYLELATATTSTARMKVVCIQSLGK